MESKTGDLYANTNSCHYLRINGVYYQRIDGKGWGIILEEQAPAPEKWWPLHELQRAAYLPALQEKGFL